MNVSREHVKSDAPPQRIGRAVFGERLDEHQQRTDGIVAGQQRGENFPQPLAEARTKDRAALLQTRRFVNGMNGSVSMTIALTFFAPSGA